MEQPTIVTLYRKRFKPVVAWRGKEPTPEYHWHVVAPSALQEVMPSNDRLHQLITNMAIKGEPKRYGNFWWKAELFPAPKEKTPALLEQASS